MTQFDPAILARDHTLCEDYLGSERLAHDLAHTVQNILSPAAIAVTGEWGSGKTTLMRYAYEEIAASSRTAHICWFDAWLYDASCPIVASLAAEVLSSLNVFASTKAKLTSKESLAGIAKGVVGALLHIGLKKLDFDGAEDFLKYFQAGATEGSSHSIKSVRTGFETVVREALQAVGKERLVVFIDDLDRCSLEHMLTVIDSLKLLFGVEGTVFVLGLNLAMAQSAIRARYGVHSDTTTYLERIIDLDFSVPRKYGIAEKFALERLSLIADKDAKRTLECAAILCTHASISNPRTIKRVLNHTLLATDRLEAFPITASPTLENDKQARLVYLCYKFGLPSLHDEVGLSKHFWRTAANALRTGGTARSDLRQSADEATILRTEGLAVSFQFALLLTNLSDKYAHIVSSI